MSSFLISCSNFCRGTWHGIPIPTDESFLLPSNAPAADDAFGTSRGPSRAHQFDTAAAEGWYALAQGRRREGRRADVLPSSGPGSAGADNDGDGGGVRASADKPDDNEKTGNDGADSNYNPFVSNDRLPDTV